MYSLVGETSVVKKVVIRSFNIIETLEFEKFYAAITKEMVFELPKDKERKQS